MGWFRNGYMARAVPPSATRYTTHGSCTLPRHAYTHSSHRSLLLVRMWMGCVVCCFRCGACLVDPRPDCSGGLSFRHARDMNKSGWTPRMIMRIIHFKEERLLPWRVLVWHFGLMEKRLLLSAVISGKISWARAGCVVKVLSNGVYRRNSLLDNRFIKSWNQCILLLCL